MRLNETMCLTSGRCVGVSTKSKLFYMVTCTTGISCSKKWTTTKHTHKSRVQRVTSQKSLSASPTSSLQASLPSTFQTMFHTHTHTQTHTRLAATPNLPGFEKLLEKYSSVLNESQELDVVFLDWQMYGQGHVGLELNYFFANSRDYDANEDLLSLQCYYATLVSTGVSDYEWEEFLEDFYVSVLEWLTFRVLYESFLVRDADEQEMLKNPKKKELILGLRVAFGRNLKRLVGIYETHRAVFFPSSLQEKGKKKAAKPAEKPAEKRAEKSEAEPAVDLEAAISQDTAPQQKKEEKEEERKEEEQKEQKPEQKPEKEEEAERKEEEAKREEPQQASASQEQPEEKQPVDE
eukprot:TRINITY_DN144_c0_g1_i9.p1 TRINITY_DN144_c0_g1~~TRINITY_DN144_c0_g1_i9.p1  ORF type:complete len:349 (+),score=120.41 TRINITY_DN144_c0_g1_i9:726-1772(+)